MSFREFRELSRDPRYLSDTPHFTSREYRLDRGERFIPQDPSRFAVLTVLRGGVAWDGREARQGEFILSPVRSAAVTAAERDTVLLSTTV